MAEEYYIPLDEDCLNILDVYKMMNDKTIVEKIQRFYKEAVLSESRLQRKQIVAEIKEFAEDAVTERRLSSANQERIEERFSCYWSEIQKISERFGRRRQLARKVYAVGVALGAERYLRSTVNLINKSRNPD